MAEGVAFYVITRTPVIPLRGLRRITFFFRWAGFTCGTLDICAALIVYQHFGRPPMRLLQGITAGADLDHGDAERIHDCEWDGGAVPGDGKLWGRLDAGSDDDGNVEFIEHKHRDGEQ